MSQNPPERDETLTFEVTVREDGHVVQTATFGTLEEAEAFAEAWNERSPEAACVIEDPTGDHTVWEAVEVDTALDVEYPPEFD